MYYRIGGKPYFALAFKNDSGGYELRNPRFKGSTSKDITHIRQKGEPRDTCFVFEGFMDFLSFRRLAAVELVKLKNRIVEIINQLPDDWKNKKGKRI